MIDPMDPNKVIVVTAYQEYPRLLYKGAEHATCVVTDDEQRDAKLADGWSITPSDLETDPAILRKPKAGKAA